MKKAPKTLRDAIKDGLEFDDECAEIIEKHVIGFLSQKFQLAMMSDKSLVDLWNDIIKKELL